MRVVRAEDTPIVFSRPEFPGGPAWSEETIDKPGSNRRSVVARFEDRAEGTWIEIVYAVQDNRVLGSRTSVEGDINWLHPLEPLFWGSRGTMSAPWGTVRYRLFSMPERHTSCVGFSSGWNHAPDDPLRLPRERLVGLYCRPESIPVDDTAARDVIGNLQLRLLPVAGS